MTIYDTGPYVPFAILLFLVLGCAGLAIIVDAITAKRRLRAKVFANLDSAYEGGYFEPGEYLDGASAVGIAFDLRAFADDMAEHNATELQPYVRDWLFQKGIPCKG